MNTTTRYAVDELIGALSARSDPNVTAAARFTPEPIAVGSITFGPTGLTFPSDNRDTGAAWGVLNHDNDFDGPEPHNTQARTVLKLAIDRELKR
jgi:hypothetical protein